MISWRKNDKLTDFVQLIDERIYMNMLICLIKRKL